MPSADTLHTRIAGMRAEDFQVHSSVSGPYDFKASLNSHFDAAFSLDARFATELRDAPLHATLNQALASPKAVQHLNRHLGRAPDATTQADDCLYFYQTLSAQLTAQDLTSIANRNTDHGPYKVCSLAQDFWARQICLTRRDCFIAAALLLHANLAHAQDSPRPPAPALELDDYLSIPSLLDHLMGVKPGTDRLEHLFEEVLQVAVYYQNLSYRAPTRREQAAGIRPDASAKAVFHGIWLNAPAAEVVDAQLHSQAFDDWARRLAISVQWPATAEQPAHHLALAEQALIDLCYPPEQRQAGHILDFQLFSEHNGQVPLGELRHDLVNSIQAWHQCLPAIAELMGEMLMRRFAPELLLQGDPTLRLQAPDLRWSTLRQGAAILVATRQPLTVEAAEQALGNRIEHTPAPHAQGETLALWAQLNGAVSEPLPWSARHWQLALDHYLNAWHQDDLRDLPNRFAEAERLLHASGIDPQGRNVDNRAHLEAYLDHGANYLGHALPDLDAWYETAFEAWMQRATTGYRAVFQRFIAHLPQDLQDHLEQRQWRAYAVDWPRYTGPVKGAIPLPGDTPATHWQPETATQGLLLLIPGEQRDTLCEMFPERLVWRLHDIEKVQEHALREHALLAYADYNQTRRPWEVQDSPGIRPIASAPADDARQTLAQHYASQITLGNRTALHALGKGATGHELFLARKRQTRLDRYLLDLFAKFVPLLSCLNIDSAEQALGCGLDVLGTAGSVIAVGGRLFKPLGTLKRTRSLHAGSARQGARQAAIRWSVHGIPAQAYRQPAGLRRWHSAPELPQAGPWQGGLTTQERVLPGQTPALWKLPPATTVPLAWALPEAPRLIIRDADTLDAMINGVAYRWSPGTDTARRLQHAPLLSTAAVEQVRAPYSDLAAARIALRFSPAANEAGTPRFGQLASHAFQTVRIEPAPMRWRPHDAKADTWTHVMVREGKVVHYTPRTSRPLKVLAAEEAGIRLGVISPPVYHRRIIAEPSSERWFGLPEDLPAEQVRLINQYCPPLRLGGLARSVPDRRTLRGAVIDRQDQQWLIVEADLGVFYGAPWSDPPTSATRPGSSSFKLSRITDGEAIEDYLRISETYRIVATRAALQRDIDNLAHLLHDWIDQHRIIDAAERNPFAEFLMAVQARQLPEHARNILTQTPAQDALAGLARKGIVGLNREIIPHWQSFTQADVTQREHIVGILDALLPVRGSTTAYTRTSAATLPEQANALRRHLTGANLAFARVTLRDGQRRVYYSLSGGKSRRRLQLQHPPGSEQPSVTYIDARGSAFDPRFTELTTLRRSDFLYVDEHRRHLDAERLIASALNHDLLAHPEQVHSIHLFTLFDTCRSCGGFVLPRLRLDYPQADFSITWLLAYRE